MTSSTKSVEVEVTKKTTVEGDRGLELRYRPGIQARNIVIQRSGANYGPASSSSHSQYRQNYQSVGLNPNAYSTISKTGVQTVAQSREQEKKDMQDLNERLASYIEKVRFLEAQNRKLADELDKLKSKWGKETSQIKAMFEAELDQARKLLDDAVKDKSRLEIHLASREEIVEDLRDRLDEALKDAARHKETAERYIQQLSDYEGEVGLLRRRFASIEGERDKDKALIKKLQAELNAVRTDVDNQTLLYVDAENRRQTLEEELNFLKALHEQELKELQALALRDSTSENREYWKSEMGAALREIQLAYDDKLDGMRGELESYYNLKVKEFNTGNTKVAMEVSHFKEESRRQKDQLAALREKLAEQEGRLGQLMRELEEVRREKEEREREMEQRNGELSETVVKLRAEMEAMLHELQVILDAKLGLELEIAAYRRLLEGEESRVGLRQSIDRITQNESHSSSHVTVRQTEQISGAKKE